MSFFDRQPPLFDAKKRLGTSSAGNSSAAIPNFPLHQQASNDELDSQPGMSESWVELAPSRASICSSVEAILVDRDGAEQLTMHKDSRASPVSLQSPHVEFETMEQVKNRLVKDMLPPGKNTDWIWDWSSRPEALMGQQRLLKSRGNVESTLTTPPNSPEPSEFDYVVKSPFYRFEVIISLVVSNVMTFVIGATVGFCICKKMSKIRNHFH